MKLLRRRRMKILKLYLQKSLKKKMMKRKNQKKKKMKKMLLSACKMKFQKSLNQK